VPTKSAKTSGEASAAQEESCVYDFLYYDARRIGSFQAQLGGYGAPGKIRHQQQSGESSLDSAGSKAQGGVPTIASGELAAQIQRSVQYGESLDQEYDPFWINGLNLHNDLSSRALLKSDLEGAQIGDFVDIQGALSVVDFAMFQNLWSKPSIQALVSLGVQGPVALEAPKGKHLNRAARERESSAMTPAERLAKLTTAEFIGDILSAIPHRVQARLLTDARQTVYANLKAADLVIEASDVFLKHGIAVSGRWRIFGVLDALPDAYSPDPLKTELIANFTAQPFGQMASGMLPLLQAGYARPPEAWAVTPIMVFREISAR
jgi:hypothetical protein